eukprot:ANDGO_01135.mRNA.1 Zuotin
MVFLLGPAGLEETSTSAAAASELPFSLRPTLLTVLCIGNRFSKLAHVHHPRLPDIASASQQSLDDSVSESDYRPGLGSVLDADSYSFADVSGASEPSVYKTEDFYAILGIPDLRFRASESEIRKAYRSRVLEVHPDKISNANADASSAASSASSSSVSSPTSPKSNLLSSGMDIDEAFKQLTKAQETLLDPVRRRAHDSQLAETMFPDVTDSDVNSVLSKCKSAEVAVPIKMEGRPEPLVVSLVPAEIFVSLWSPLFARIAVWSAEPRPPKLLSKSFPGVDKLIASRKDAQDVPPAASISPDYSAADAFYKFYLRFRSWRDFSHELPDVLASMSSATSRDERRFHQQALEKHSKKRKLEAAAMVLKLAEQAQKSDPRFALRKALEEAEKENKKWLKLMEKKREEEEAERKKKEDDDRKKKEDDDRVALKKAKENEQRQMRRERKRFKDSVWFLKDGPRLEGSDERGWAVVSSMVHKALVSGALDTIKLPNPLPSGPSQSPSSPFPSSTSLEDLGEVSDVTSVTATPAECSDCLGPTAFPSEEEIEDVSRRLTRLQLSALNDALAQVSAEEPSTDADSSDRTYRSTKEIRGALARIGSLILAIRVQIARVKKVKDDAEAAERERFLADLKARETADASKPKWTKQQQTELEQALKKVPPNDSKRWERVANMVPEKTPAECEARFRDMLEAYKKKKDQTVTKK